MAKTFRLWIGSCVGAILLLLAGTAALRGVGVFKPQHIIISRQTTWITGPLDKDGGVDYAAWLNQRDSRGVTPANNAVVALLKITGTGPGVLGNKTVTRKILHTLGIKPPDVPHPFMSFFKYEKLHDLKNKKGLPSGVGHHPWAAAQHPHIAAWLAGQHTALAEATAAARMKHAYFPVFVLKRNGYLDMDSPFYLLGDIANISEAFAARSMLLASSGDYAGAWRDIVTIHKLGNLAGRGPFLLNLLTCDTVNSIAMSQVESLAKTGKIPASLCKHWLVSLRRWQKVPSLAAAFNTGERLAGLTDFQYWATHGLAGFSRDLNPGHMRGSRLNFNAMMVRWNTICNRIVIAAHKATYKEEQIALNQACFWYDQFSDADFAPMASQMPARLVAKRLIDYGFNVPIWPAVLLASERSERNMARVGLALAAFRATNGVYPPALATLIPKYFKTVPSNAFTGKPLHYCDGKNSHGYLLYCFEISGGSKKSHVSGELTLTSNWPGPKIRRWINLPIGVTKNMWRHRRWYNLPTLVTCHCKPAPQTQPTPKLPKGFPSLGR